LMSHGSKSMGKLSHPQSANVGHVGVAMIYEHSAHYLISSP
jgi:hypothetical protein